MASLFTPYDFKSMQPKGIVQGQFGSGMMNQQPQGNLMSIIELIKKLQQGNQPMDNELTRHLEELSRSTVAGKF